MQAALGKMGLAPSDFWEMSPREFNAAMIGFQAFHCAPSGDDVEPPSMDELDAMLSEFPDGTMADHIANLDARRLSRG